MGFLGGEFDFMDPPLKDNTLNSMHQLWVSVGSSGAPPCLNLPHLSITTATHVHRCWLPLTTLVH